MRQVLRAILGVLVGVLLPFAAVAAVAADQSIPAFEKMTVAGHEVLVLRDALSSMPRERFPSATDAQFAAANGNQPIPASVNVFAVKVNKQWYLIDTGNGTDKRRGYLRESLQLAGIAPDEVAGVLLTHLHQDHFGGLMYQGKAAFPNATVYVAEPELAYWQQQGSAFLAMQDALKLKTFKGDVEMVPGVNALAIPGHTPGQTAFALSGPQGTVLFWGDVIHGAALQLAHPEISASYDIDPVAAAATRQQVLKKVTEQGWYAAGAHLPFPGIVRLEALSQGGYVIQGAVRK